MPCVSFRAILYERSPERWGYCCMILDRLHVPRPITVKYYLRPSTFAFYDTCKVSR